MSEDINQLLKQGIEAAKAGNKAEARKLFEQATQIDENNEKAWFWLASVVETDDERRVCLSNVLLINPDNERAQKLMEKLDAKTRKAYAEEEVMPGISRRQLLLFGGGGAAVIVIIILLFVGVTASRNAQIAAETQAVLNTNATSTAIIAFQATQAMAATETQVALVSPTPTPSNTPDRPTLPAEFTPTPTETPPVSPTPLPPPSGLVGSIVAWSGRDVDQDGFLPIMVIPLSGGAPTRISVEEGRNPDVSADGQRVVYTRYFPVVFDFGLEVMNITGAQPTVLSDRLPVIQAQMPAFCPSSNLITFVAIPAGGGGNPGGAAFTETAQPPYQLYTLNLDTQELRRLTNDLATYTYPDFSPDCTRIVVVKNDSSGTNPGADIVIVDTSSLGQTSLTSDLGNYVESSPRWSPDGTMIVYTAESVNEPGNGEIFLRRADGGGVPLLPVRDPGNDIFPIFSPDNRYIAFASNRNGSYDIYIYDQQSSALYQLTASEDADYPGSWVG